MISKSVRRQTVFSIFFHLEVAMQFDEFRAKFESFVNDDSDPESLRLRALYEECKPVIEKHIAFVRDLSTTDSKPLS